jgi:phenylalanyl-tRNA synthetase alpha chain
MTGQGKQLMYSVPKLNDFSAAALDAAARELKSALESEGRAVFSEGEWKLLRDRWMARKNGILTQLNDEWLKAAPGPTKRDVGQRVNELRKIVEEQIEAAHSRVTSVASASRLEQEKVDVTLPGTRRKLGIEHPLIRTMNEIVGVFKAMGYSVAEGPEVETDYYNFESLNFPPDHPARDTQDTLIVAGQQGKPLRERLLLRTHTSPVQIRTMEKQPPPVRVVIPGKVHRAETADATHSSIFHQVEGLAVDANITFCDLKGTLDQAAKAMFGSSVRTRFYPSFFPFTEPSADMQISCFKCGGSGRLDGGRCTLCKASGWIEILGSGMVDPNLYGFVGYDAKKYSGFAFGMGVERIAILKYGIDDIQLFYQGDVRFLEQFA